MYSFKRPSTEHQYPPKRKNMEACEKLVPLGSGVCLVVKRMNKDTHLLGLSDNCKRPCELGIIGTYPVSRGRNRSQEYQKNADVVVDHWRESMISWT